MCLGLVLDRPEDVLESGVVHGFEYHVMASPRYAYRCGYVKLPSGHPWHGNCEPDVDVHGGVTFADSDRPCDKGGADDGFWIGFDCGHYNDLGDPGLEAMGKRDILEWNEPGAKMWTTADVVAECYRVALQANQVAGKPDYAV